MKKEQKQLLYEIIKLKMQLFFLHMSDHLNMSDYALRDKLSSEKYKLEQRYNKKYGELPKWRHIEDVQNMQKQLEKELNE